VAPQFPVKTKPSLATHFPPAASEIVVLSPHIVQSVAFGPFAFLQVLLASSHFLLTVLSNVQSLHSQNPGYSSVLPSSLDLPLTHFKQ